MKKTFKFMSMIIATVLMCVSFTSCSDDDEPGAGTYDDFYMEVTDVSGGGLNPQNCALLKAELNSDLVAYYWGGVEQNKAIYNFDSEMDDWCSVFSSGMDGVSGTLRIVFALKNKSGRIIKQTTLNVTSYGASLS